MMKIEAMNAYASDQKVLSASGYIYEPKLDGFRALCYVDNSVKFISRNDKDITHKFFSHITFRKQIAAKSCILDGEIVAYTPAGMPSFRLLVNGGQAYYAVFDILMKDGVSLIHKPLHERKRILYDTVIEGGQVQLVPFTTSGKKLWTQVKKTGLEGVMAKENDSKYYPGLRSKVWLKVKQVQTVDCVIVGYKIGRRQIASLALALYDAQGNLHHIGNVGTGFNEELLRELFISFQPLKIAKNPTIDDIKHIVWLKPQLVCEIKYQEVTQHAKLRIPVFQRLRPDKKAKGCTFKDQLPEALHFITE